MKLSVLLISSIVLFPLLTSCMRRKSQLRKIVLGKSILKSGHGPILQGRKTSVDQLKNSKSQSRRHIVKCCGKKSCLSVESKTKSRSLSLTHRMQSPASSAPSKNMSVTEAGIGLPDKVPATESGSQTQQHQPELEVTNEAQSENTSPTEPFMSSIRLEMSASTSAEIRESEMVPSSAMVEQSADATSTSPLSETKSRAIFSSTSLSSDISITPISIQSSTSTTIAPTTSTSTTTTACPLIVCGNYKKSLNETSEVKEQKAHEKLLACNGTTFMLFSLPLPYVNASAYCLKKGMKLLSLGLEKEYKLSSKLLRDAGLTVKEYWTDGVATRTSDPCRGDSTINWCSFPQNLSSVWWKANIATKLDDVLEKQVILKVDPASENAALSFSNATLELPFLCKCPRENNCPSSCMSNASLFNSNGTLNDRGKLGSWRQICNETYLFLNEMGTWKETYTKCCSLRMRPLWFKDLAEMQCLAKEVAANWTLNLNYWTAATQQSCWGQWSWCSGDSPDPLDNNLNWANGQPDNAKGNEGCLHVRLLKNSSTPMLSDRNCSSKFIMACKNSKQESVGSSCKKAVCPDTCLKNDTLFSGGKIIDHGKYGNWHAGCGKDFLFAKTNLSYNDAHAHCCSLGMQLLSIEFRDVLECLTSIVDIYPRAKYLWAMEKDFWTSGTSTGCAEKFEWCSAKTRLSHRETAWKSGHPLPGEQCVTVDLFEQLSGKNSSLATAPCSEKKQFICERAKKPTMSLQKNLECCEIWKLSNDELVSLQKPTFNASNAPRHVKCYLRCIGVSFDLYDFGNKQYGTTLLSTAEEVVGDGEQSLQSSMDVATECQTSASEDECTVASEVYACNNQKNPSVTQAVVSQVNSLPAESSNPSTAAKTQCVLTPMRTCPPVVNCTVDTARRNTVLAGGTDNAGGKFYTTAAGRKYYFMYKIQSYDSASLECCLLGMKVAEFETNEIYTDFFSAPFNLGGNWIYIGATFSNGDGMDSWCSNYQTIPSNIITSPFDAYENCNNEKVTHRLVIDGNRIAYLAKPHTVNDIKYFLCMDNV